MKEWTYEGKTFLECANEAATKIRKINRLVSGTECLEDGSLLGDVDDSIYFMIKMYLTMNGLKTMDNDSFNDMATELMSAEKGEINGIIGKYCGNSI